MKIKIIATLVLVMTLSCSCAFGQSSSPQQSPSTATRTSPVPVGELAPDFTLEDDQGRKVTLSSSRGKTSVVLVFYRGYW